MNKIEIEINGHVFNNLVDADEKIIIYSTENKRNEDSLFTDTVFDVEKEVIKFTDGDANKYVGSAKWTNILNFGASYSGVIRF